MQNQPNSGWPHTHASLTEEVNGVTTQLSEDGHIGFPTAMSVDATV